MNIFIVILKFISRVSSAILLILTSLVPFSAVNAPLTTLLYMPMPLIIMFIIIVNFENILNKYRYMQNIKKSKNQ
ncbi:MAG: hypothetical protein HRT37_24430 [Alteromonadaceae bacterium]|nr:hypothetical protein [Alteromonadaceae bacterium]